MIDDFTNDQLFAIATGEYGEARTLATKLLAERLREQWQSVLERKLPQATTWMGKRLSDLTDAEFDECVEYCAPRGVDTIGVREEAERRAEAKKLAAGVAKP